MPQERRSTAALTRTIPPGGASPTGLVDPCRPARFAIVAHRLHLGANDGVPFIDPAQEYVTEVQRPNPVVDFFQADLVLLEGVGEKEQPLLEADRPPVGDPLGDEMARILDRRGGSPLRPRGRAATRRRRGAPAGAGGGG